MNDPTWWIITTAITALAIMLWWFFRRSIKQSDERDAETNTRVTLLEAKIGAQKTELDQKLTHLNTSILAMKDSIIATVYDSSRHVNENIANLRVEMARDYLPRAEHRQDVQRLEDRLMEGT